MVKPDSVPLEVYAVDVATGQTYLRPVRRKVSVKKKGKQMIKKPKEKHVLISEAAHNFLSKAMKTYYNKNINRERHYAITYFLAMNTKKIIKEAFLIPTFINGRNLYGGCRHLPEIPGDVMAKMMLEIAKTNLTPCGIARIGIYDNTQLDLDMRGFGIKDLARLNPDSVFLSFNDKNIIAEVYNLKTGRIGKINYVIVKNEILKKGGEKHGWKNESSKKSSNKVRSKKSKRTKNKR